MTGQTPKSPQSLKLVLKEGNGQGRIAVDLEAFFDFSFDLAEDLEDLIARWSHFATPSAKPSRRITRD